MTPQSLAPQGGDEVQLLNPSGEPSLLSTRVRQILSFEKELMLWEVRCDNGKTLVISRVRPHLWIEVTL
jgi:hypothetical protein